MPKRNIIILLAAITAIMPFLGFPRSWEDIFIACASVLVILLSVDLTPFRKKGGSKRNRRKKTGEDEVYVENIPSRSPDGFKSEMRRSF